jgi:hypothetical protein
VAYEGISPVEPCLEDSVPTRLTAANIVARIVSEPVDLIEMRELALKDEVELRSEGDFVGADAMVCTAIVAQNYARNPAINIDTHRPTH